MSRLFNMPHPGQGAYADEARAALGASCHQWRALRLDSGE